MLVILKIFEYPNELQDAVSLQSQTNTNTRDLSKHFN